MTRRRPELIRPAGSVDDVEYGVMTSTLARGEDRLHMHSPCRECPWVCGREGVFPPDAYRHSANTAADMATHMFACHMTDNERPSTCAGFLLRGATHNMAVRIQAATGKIDWNSVHDGGLRLHENYRAMAVANGVPADDPALAFCRDDV